jgi:hypothetical protein
MISKEIFHVCALQAGPRGLSANNHAGVGKKSSSG